MKMTATRLRAELYRVLDQVLETGEPVEVSRGGGVVVLRAARVERRPRAKRQPRANPDLVVGDPDDLVHFDWSRHWKPFL